MGQKWIDYQVEGKGFIVFEMGCDVKFLGDILMCVGELKLLFIELIIGDKCIGKYMLFNLNQGFYDVCVFYGLMKLYIIYGFNSVFICFG